MNCELMLTYDTPAYMFNVYKNQPSRQTGSRNLTGYLYESLWPNVRFLPSIVAEKNVTNNVHICSMWIKTNQVGKQEVGIWRVQKHFPQYCVPIWRIVTKYQISAINSCWEKCDEKWTYMFNVYKNQQSQQTGSRNLMGPKTLPTIWGTYMKLVTKYKISAINSYWENCDETYLGRTEGRKDGQTDGQR